MWRLELSRLTNRLFGKKNAVCADKALASDGLCFSAIDSNTNLEILVFMKGNKTFTVDLNAVIIMDQKVNDVVCQHLLDPHDAEIVKKSIAQYYEKNQKPLPDAFSFLKTYSPKTTLKFPNLKS